VPRIDPALRERSLGAFEGLTREECETRHPEAWVAWHSNSGTPPGGESREVALARMSSALHRIAREPGTTLVVSHGGVMRLMLLELGDPVQPIHNGAIHALEHDGERFRRA
jgi:broad specificity phosphatase PhoE